MSDPAAFERRVIAIIADTFSAPEQSITRSTVADDVDGWDSLGHSILLARLSAKLQIDIGEEIAAQSADVGQLVDHLAAAEAQKKPV